VTQPAARAGAPHAGELLPGHRGWPAARAWWHARPWLPAAIAALVVLGAAVSSITPDPIGVFWDDGVYLLSAQSLAAGDGYRYAYLPGAPPAIHYPPLYPLLLAALVKVTPAFPANVAVLKLLNPVLLSLGVFGAVQLAHRRLGMSAGASATAVAICAVTAPVLVLSNVLLSEALFFAVLTGALWLVDDAEALGGWRTAVLAGVVIAALSLVRTIGGALLPAAAASLWLRGRRREAALAVGVAIIVLAPWQLWVWQAARGFPDELRGSYGPYLEWVLNGYRRDLPLAWEVATRNAAELWNAFGVVFATRAPRVAQHAVAAAVSACLLVGVMTLLRRATATGAFFVLYAVVVLLWPYNPERFVWAVWPLGAVALLQGAKAIGERLGAKWRYGQQVATGVLVLLLAGHAAYAARGLAGGWAGSPQRSMTARLWPLVEWTATHAGTGDVVASDAHVMIALYTGRTTMPVSMLTPAEHVREKPLPQFARELGALSARYHPSVLVLSRGTRETDAVPLWAATPGAPAVTALAPVPGGGAAFALRERR
jgi:hypothetical protein